MSDTAEILSALKEHREETRQDMHELRQAVVKIADAASDMGKTMARSEERHVQHEDASRRITHSIEDHEVRIRVIESAAPDIERLKQQSEEMGELKMQFMTGKSSIRGGWKVATVIGVTLVGAAAVASALMRIAT